MQEDIYTLYQFAVNGDPLAIAEYGDAMVYGFPQDLNESRTEELVWMYNTAVRKKSVRAMLALGNLYDMGTFTRQSDAVARKLYEMAYEKAQSVGEKEMACAYLSAMYMRTHAPDEWEEGCPYGIWNWEHPMAFAPAVYLMGDMCLYGDDEFRNERQAYEAYASAKQMVYETRINETKENRRFLGQVLLRFAEIYDFGIHAPVDKKKAMLYYAEAERILKKQSENRNGFAIRALQRLEEDKKR